MSYGDRASNPYDENVSWVTTNQVPYPITPNGGDITIGPNTGDIGTGDWYEKWSTTEVKSTPDMDTCVICGDGGVNFFCELCRQAVLMFRRKVLEDMARDLMEMA